MTKSSPSKILRLYSSGRTVSEAILIYKPDVIPGWGEKILGVIGDVTAEPAAGAKNQWVVPPLIATYS